MDEEPGHRKGRYILKYNGVLLGLLKNSFLRATLTLTSASAAGQVIMLAALPLLTRLYDPDAFGVLAVFSALLGVVLVISSLRYELAIPLSKKDRHAGVLLMLSLAINLAFGIVSAVVILFWRHNIAKWSETPSLVNLLWLLPIAIITAGSYKVLRFWAVRNSDFKCIARTKISQSIANVLTQVVSGLAEIGALGLILGQVVGHSMGIKLLARNIGFCRFFKSSIASTQLSLRLLRLHYRFPKYDVPAAGVNAISAQLPNFVLAMLFNPAVAGFYYLAERVLQTPMSLVGQAVAQVFFAQSRELIKQRYLHLTLRRIALLLIILASLPTVFVFYFAEPCFVMVFGEAWREAGVYSGWLIIGLMAQFVYSPLSMALIATEDQLTNLKIHLFILLLKSVALLTGFIAADALLGVQSLAIAVFIGYGIGVVVVLHRSSSSGR